MASGKQAEKQEERQHGGMHKQARALSEQASMQGQQGQQLSNMPLLRPM